MGEHKNVPPGHQTQIRLSSVAESQPLSYCASSTYEMRAWEMRRGRMPNKSFDL